MSTFTTEVRWVCESKSGFSIDQLPNKSVDQIIDAAWDKIFDFTFDFYNATWNAAIAKFILKYYYTREIGSETVGLWKLRLNTRCAEISGKYKRMIAALEALEPADFSSNYKFAGYNNRTDDLTSTRTDDLKQETEAESKDKYSDTPQNGLSSVEDGSYLTSYRNVETSDTVENTGTQKKEDTGTQKFSYGENGYKGAETVAERVANLNWDRFNVLEQIAKEFSDCFMLLW